MFKQHKLFYLNDNKNVCTVQMEIVDVKTASTLQIRKDCTYIITANRSSNNNNRDTFHVKEEACEQMSFKSTKSK